MISLGTEKFFAVDWKPQGDYRHSSMAGQQHLLIAKIAVPVQDPQNCILRSEC